MWHNHLTVAIVFYVFQPCDRPLAQALSAVQDKAAGSAVPVLGSVTPSDSFSLRFLSFFDGDISWPNNRKCALA
jgi:hypothetical protein